MSQNDLLTEKELVSPGEQPLSDETAKPAGADASGSLHVLHSDVVPARRSLVVPGAIDDIHSALTTAASSDGPGETDDQSDGNGRDSLPADLDLHDPTVLRHEIANPLTYLQNAALLMKKEIETHNCPRQERLTQMLDTVAQAANQILGIIDAATKLPSDIPPKNPSENPHFRKIHLSGLLKTMAGSWSVLASSNGIGFSAQIEDGVYVAGSSIKLYEVLFNLVTNAIEILNIEAEERKKSGSAFSPSIDVKLKTHPAIKGLVHLFVEDNGPGIPDGLRHKLFTKGATGKGGHGIGLWRCKKIVREMGGHLDLVNNYERDELEGHEHMPGASALIELPVYEDPQDKT